MLSELRQRHPFGSVLLGDAVNRGALGETFGDKVRRALRRGLDLLLLWQDRASQRAQLASLEDCYLADMGITREDALAEAAKPFWRA